MKRALLAMLCAGCATTKTAAPVAAPTKTEATCPTTRPETPGSLDAVIGKYVEKVCFVSELALRDVVSSSEGHELDAATVRDGLVALFATGLVRDAEAIAVPLDAERVVLTWFATPYPKLSNVRVEGAKALGGDAVLDGLNPSDFAYGSGVTLQKLRTEVVEFYQAHGYPAADATVALVGTEAVVTVTEGELASIEHIRFAGVKKVKEAELREALTSKEGAVFQEDVAERDVFALNAVYFDHGMVRATVEFSRTGKELLFTVREGDVYKLGKLAFSGYALSDGDAFLKALESKKGTVFSRIAVQRDLKRIAERASKEGARVNVTPMTDVDPDKKLINVTFELEKLPGPVTF